LAETADEMFFGLADVTRQYSIEYGNTIKTMLENNEKLTDSMNSILKAMDGSTLIAKYDDWKISALGSVEDKKAEYDKHQEGEHSGAASSGLSGYPKPNTGPNTSSGTTADVNSNSTPDVDPPYEASDYVKFNQSGNAFSVAKSKPGKTWSRYIWVTEAYPSEKFLDVTVLTPDDGSGYTYVKFPRKVSGLENGWVKTS
jgi:hypothetical protein